MTTTAYRFGRLYSDALPSRRGGAVFNAHAYPTKIDPNAIALCILAHTEPGDLVVDGFAGSGTAGIAATLCERPNEALLKLADARIGDVTWGARDAVLYDVGGLASFMAEVLTHPPDPDRFASAANSILTDLRNVWGWIYEAESPGGDSGELRHTVWTEHLDLRDGEVTLWDAAVSLNPPQIRPVVRMDNGAMVRVGQAPRVMVRSYDELLRRPILSRRRTPAWVWGRSGSKLWRRAPVESDLQLVNRIAETNLLPNIPLRPMMDTDSEVWGEMHRAGYHQGMSHVHHFYTRRNLLAVAASYALVEEADPELRNPLRLWVSSYNSSHSTLMSRVVAKQGAKDLVLTSAQPGALYVSGLPVEKNVFAGLASKASVLKRAFEAVHGTSSIVRVHRRSSATSGLADNSVDYVFIDPPFGGNIQYGEVNFINEAWLGLSTNHLDEIVVSAHQGKSIDTYQTLMATAFTELFRVLKPGHYATLAFHSASSEVWAAISNAWRSAGFSLREHSYLDKHQRSFKQTTTPGAVAKDALVLLQKPLQLGDNAVPSAIPNDPWHLIGDRLETLPEDDPGRGRDQLWGYLVMNYVAADSRPPMDAREFFAGLKERFGI